MLIFKIFIKYQNFVENHSKLQLFDDEVISWISSVWHCQNNEPTLLLFQLVLDNLSITLDLSVVEVKD